MLVSKSDCSTLSPAQGLDSQTMTSSNFAHCEIAIAGTSTRMPTQTTHTEGTCRLRLGGWLGLMLLGGLWGVACRGGREGGGLAAVPPGAAHPGPLG